ncbi:hypothetical protein NDY24_13255 [Xanthomonas hortorum pv. pelargonii]|nr:hypothetical protein NDY24_13255 [Xanthomonas hortorum pv. pelargonii]
MAKDNELAHHIPGGMALPFLEGCLDAQTNATRLDNYLQMVTNARRFTGKGTTHRDLDRCVELAAQYLYQTRWFEGASSKQLAYVANKLEQGPEPEGMHGCNRVDRRTAQAGR